MDIFRNLFKNIQTDNKYKFYWRALATTLAGVVVFVTTYSLILPAITMEVEVAEEMPGFVVEDDEYASFDVVPDPDAEEVYDYSESVEDSDFVSPDEEWDSDSIITDEENEDEPDNRSSASGIQEGLLSYTIRELTQELENETTKEKIKVHLLFEESALIPDGTRLEVVDISEAENESEYDSYKTAAEEAVRKDDSSWSEFSTRLYALNLLYGEETVIPEDKIQVELQFTPHITSERCKVLCFDDLDFEQATDEVALPLVLEEEEVSYQYAKDTSIEQITFDAESVCMIGIAEDKSENIAISDENSAAQDADNAYNNPSTEGLAPNEEVSADEEPDVSSIEEGETEPDTETEETETEIEPEAETETETEIETETDALPAQEFSGSTKTMRVQVVADEGAFPDGTTMVLKDVADDQTLSAIEDAAIEDVSKDRESGRARVSSVHAVDITFLDVDGKEIEPLKPIHVFMTPAEMPEDKQSSPVIVHVDNDGNAQTIESLPEEALSQATGSEQISGDVEDNKATNADYSDEEPLNYSLANETVAFEADAFSVYALVYTVDFHWEVNGKLYEFSLPGGGFVSMEKLIEVLGISESSVQGAKEKNDADSASDAAENTNSSVALTLDDVQVSEETKKFVEDIESVEFSNPELVWVGKNEEYTTVGSIKEANGLACENSAELTDAQIVEINEHTVESGEWVLISVKPFLSEETLTVTMKDGEVFTILVTDAQDPLGLDGRTFAIVTQRNGNNGNGNWYALQSSVSSNMSSRGYYLDALQVNHTSKDGSEYVDISANAWKFEYNKDADAYYVSCNGKYLYMDPSVTSKNQTPGPGNEKAHAVNLVENKEQADNGTLVKISRDDNGNYYFMNNRESDNVMLWNYGSSAYWLDQGTNDANSQIRLCLPEDSGSNASHKASLISAADTQPGQKIIVYQRIWVTGSDGQPTANYYAIDGNGNLVQVTNSSDAIYWKGDQSIEWTMKEVGTGYYTLYNEKTGKYLTPKSNGIVHTADEAAFEGDEKHLSVSLLGKDDGKYTSAITSWDYNASVSYGMTATTSSVTSIQRQNSQDFYFAARDPIVLDQLTTVDTVDSKTNGIKITMYDWGDTRGADAHRQFWDQNGTDSGQYNYGNTQSIPLQDRLKMMQGIMGSSSDDYKVGQVTRNILSNYYDTETQTAPNILTNTGHNLSELFSDSYIKGGVGNKGQFNNLFLQSVYDETGFYKYSCFENYAYLPAGSTDFTVYEQIGTPSNRVNDQYTSTNINFARGQFMPYNPIGSSMEYRLNERDPDLAALDSNNPRYHERVYYIENENAPSGTYDVDGVPDYIHGYNSTMSDSNNPETYANYFFGMKMEAKFTQEPGGIAKNGDPMVYEFNGDDDLWIYIDGVLVLDLGGIHDAFRGKINFQNGKVTCNASNGQNTTIKEMFRQAHKYPDGSDWPEGDNSRVDEFFNGDTFKDNSTHEFTMFYMERGASASNLDMRFNLTVLKESQFRVKKEMPETMTGKVIQSKYADAAFYYEAYVEDDSSATGYTKVSRDYLTSHNLSSPKYEDGTDVVWKSDSTSETKFEVKPGSTAVFPATDDTIRWYVVEVEPEAGSNMLSNYEVSNDDPDTSVADGTKSLEKKIKSRNIVTFRNKPDDKLVNELQITKRINGTAYDETDSFEYRIFFEDTDALLVAYREGEYYQTDSQGRYIYYHNGERRIQSENPNGPYTYIDTDGNTVTNSPTPRIAEHTSTNGSVGNILDGDTIYIKGLLEGTDFYVYERTDYDYMTKDGTTVDGKYTFEGTEVTDAFIRETGENAPAHIVGHLYDAPGMDGVNKYNPSDYEKAQAATGTIIQDKDAKVLVKNKVKSKEIPIKVEKNWSGIDDPDTNEAIAGSSVTVTLGRYIVSDKGGNFTIQKDITVDQGQVTDAGFSAVYYIRGTDAAGNTKEYGPYPISGAGQVSGTITPGTYKVYEEQISADDTYTWTHSSTAGNGIDLVITDGQDGDPTPVVFTSNANVKTGDLYIKSTLSGVAKSNFSTVNYTVYKEDGVTRATYANGEQIPEISFAEADTSVASDGKKLSGLKVGTYVVRETAPLPDVNGYTVSDHVPVGSSQITATVTTDTANPAKVEFSTTYIEAASNSTYKIGKPDAWHTDSKTGAIEFPVGTTVTMSFKGKGNWDRINNISNGNPLQNNELITYGGESLPYEANLVNGHYEYSITFTVKKDAVLRVNVNGTVTGNDPEIYDISITKVQGRQSAPRRHALGSAPHKTIKAGTDTISPDNYGDNPSDPLKNYTDDTTFVNAAGNNEVYKLTLNQENQWKWQQDLPATDENGNKYYYYIKEVVETNMPTGTTCAIQLDGTKKYLVGENLHVDASDNPLPLQVKNTVVEVGTIKLQKLVKVDGAIPTDANKAYTNGIYEFEVTKSGDATVLHTVTIEYENGAVKEAKLDGASVTLTGGFVQIDNLEEGDYVITETAQANGMSLYRVEKGTSRDLSAKTITVHVTPGDTIADAATAIFTNNAETTSVKVKKQWLTSNGQLDTDKNESVIIFTLNQVTYKADGSHTEAPYSGSYTNSITGNNEVEITNLPVHGMDGTEPVTYAYTIRENVDMIPGYHDTYGTSEDGKEWIIYNTPAAGTDKSDDLTVTKLWQNTTGTENNSEHTDDEITFTVSRHAVKTTYVPLTISLFNSSSNGQAAQVNRYYVKPGTDVTLTFYNRDSAHFLIKDGSSRFIGEDRITGIYPRYTTFRVDGAMDVSLQLSDREWALFIQGARVNDTWVENAGNATSLPATTKWDYSISANGSKTLYDDAKDLANDLKGGTEEENQPTYTYTIKGGNQITEGNDFNPSAENWVATLHQLPTYAKVGNDYYTYTYTISEFKINGEQVDYDQDDTARGFTDDYLVTLDQDAHKITNKAREKTNVDATKAWLNADNSTEAPANAAVTFELFANGDATGKQVVLDGTTVAQEITTIQADASKSEETKAAEIAGLQALKYGELTTAWKAEWTDLPVKDTSEKAITYTVKEVSGFAEYENQHSDGVAAGGTIRNKEKTYGFDILKVAAAPNTSTKLAGAQFTAQKIRPTSTTNTVVTDGDLKASNPVTTGSDGKASFVNLTAGYYAINETKTPDGYVITGEGTFYVKVDSSGITLLEKKTGEKTVEEGTIKLWFEDAKTAKVDNVTIGTQGTAVTFTVENTPGAALPSTGGPGTRFFTIFGSILILLSGALLWRRRRLV